MARLSDIGVLVTGAAGGLGEAIARRLLSEGAQVVIGDIDGDRGAETAATMGDRARFVPLDVSDESSWQGFVEHAEQFMGQINGLVNNAAYFWMGALTDMPPVDARRTLDVNLLGPLLGTQAVAPRMAEAGGGSIVNISSIDGKKSMNSVAAYSASKWGLRGLTRASALELGRDGIRVNAVLPSNGNPSISAPFVSQMDFERLVPSVPQPILEDAGVKRDVTMGDVAAMVAFLMSDDSATCTGADFLVDAGVTAGDNLPGLPGF